MILCVVLTTALTLWVDRQLNSAPAKEFEARHAWTEGHKIGTVTDRYRFNNNPW